MTSAYHLELRPVKSSPGRYSAFLDGKELCSSRQPFFTAARALLEQGADPAAVLTASHTGSSIVALRSTVGEAAKWMVEEGDNSGVMRRRRCRPQPEDATQGVAERPPGDDSRSPASSMPLAPRARLRALLPTLATAKAKRRAAA
jgi:hypothetical protein